MRAASSGGILEEGEMGVRCLEKAPVAVSLDEAHQCLHRSSLKDVPQFRILRVLAEHLRVSASQQIFQLCHLQAWLQKSSSVSFPLSSCVRFKDSPFKSLCPCFQVRVCRGQGWWGDVGIGDKQLSCCSE